MKEFVEATQEADLCLTELSLKAIGGQINRKKHKSLWRSVISVRDLHQTYTSQEEFLTSYPAPGHLLNGA